MDGERTKFTKCQTKLAQTNRSDVQAHCHARDKGCGTGGERPEAHPNVEVF